MCSDAQVSLTRLASDRETSSVMYTALNVIIYCMMTPNGVLEKHNGFLFSSNIS